MSGPFFGGWELYHLKGSPADPNRIYASQSSGWFGQMIQRSNDGGKTWEPVGNKFVYDGVPGTHQWYDGTPHPWEFKRVWHLEPSLTDPDTVYAGVEDAALSGRPTAARRGGNARTARPRLRPALGSPAPAACACTRSCSIRRTRNGCSSRFRPLERFEPTTAARRGSRSTKGLHSQHIPEPDCRGRPLRASARDAPLAAVDAVHAEALGRDADATTPAISGRKSAATCRPISGS